VSKNKPVTIRGVTYESGAIAGVALGVSRHAVYKAQRLGRLETVGLGHTGGEWLKKGMRIAVRPISIQGVKYPSQRIAAEVLGVSPITISSAKRRGRLATVSDRRRA